MIDKKTARLRRAKKARRKIRELAVHRLSVHRTPRHMYAQILAPNGKATVVAASTVESAIKSEVAGTGNVTAAGIVGKTVAQRARDKGIEKVAFDRSGFKYHGRIKALADAAREAGLKL